MVVGVPREIKVEEKRVALVPGGVEALVARGHRVLIETGAGGGSGFEDLEYVQAGAEIAPGAPAVYERSDMILKVKEPLASECEMLREEQVLFTYLHLAAAESLTMSLLRKKTVAIAYETVATDDGLLPSWRR